MTGVEAVEQNLLAFFRHFARHRHGGLVEDLDGISIASSGIDFHMFNAALFSKPVAHQGGDLERRLDLAAAALGHDSRGWAFWVCEEKLAGPADGYVARAFRGRELFLSLRHPGMVCHEFQPPRRVLPALDILPVKDRDSRLMLAHVNSIAFNIPFEWCRQLYDSDEIWNGNFTGFLGCANGEVVTSAAVLTAAEAIGVYCVATLPGHERKGYAEAVTREAVIRAQRASGIRRSVLQSTSKGFPLYRRMGYEVVTHFDVYST